MFKRNATVAIAVAAIVFAAGGELTASLQSPAWSLGSSTGVLDWNTSTDSTFQGTGYIGLMQNNGVKAFGNFFGLSAPIPIATVMQVDLTDVQQALSEGKSIQSAVLSFYVGMGLRGTSSMTVTSFETDGNLGFVWNPNALGTVVADITNFSDNAIDVTDLLKNRVAGGNEWLGLHLKANSGTILTVTNVAGKSYPDAAHVLLTVNYSDGGSDDVFIGHNPEPSALAIWGILGVAICVGRRRFVA